MKRREFIKNSALTLSFAQLFSGCNNLIKISDKQVARKMFKNMSIPIISLGDIFSYPTDGKCISQTEFSKMINFAMLHGMNYFDMTYMHSSETVLPMLAKALKRYKREDYILASKISIFNIHSRADVEKTVNRQLKENKCEYFDNYLISNIFERNIKKLRKNNVYYEILKLKEKGKIKNIGFAGPSDAKFFEEVLSEYDWDYYNIKTSYYDWLEDGVYKIYEIALNHKIPVFMSESLRGGSLTELGDEIDAMIKENNFCDSQGSFAIRWGASKNNAVTVLLDANNYNQLKEYVEIFSDFKPFNKKDEQLTFDINRYLKKHNYIKCTKCGLCKDNCPFKLEISNMISLYNQFKLNKKSNRNEEFLNAYLKIDKSKRAHNCNGCLKCQCFNLIDIPKTLKEIDKQIQKISYS